MNAIPVNVAVVDKKTVVEAQVLRNGKNGKPVKIKAIANGKYILAEGEKGVAPENITVKRVGKSLWVILEDGDLDKPDLIIEDFFVYPGQLVGKAEDNAFHEYIASDARDDHEAAALADGDYSALVLGSESVPGLDNLLIAENGLINPMLLGLGLLSAIGAAAGIIYHNHKKDHGKSGEGEGGNLPDPVFTRGATIDAVTDNVGAIQGPLASGDYTDDATPTLSGTGTNPGNTVEIWDNGTKIGEAIVDQDGNWTFTPGTALAEGDHSFTVIERDGKGNTSQPSEPFELIIDLKAPAQATLDSVFDDHGSLTGLIGNGEATDDNTPTLSGKAEPYSTVSIYDNGEKIGEALTDANGNWTFTPATALADGEHAFTVVAADRAGNIGLPSAPHIITIDTQAPVNPGIGEVTDNVGSIVGPVDNGGSTDDRTPTIGGGGTPGDVVTIIDDGKPIGSTVVGDDGKWEFTPEQPLEDGEHNIGIIITDPVGNESAPSDDYTIIVDTQAPDKPRIVAVIDNQGEQQGELQPGDTTDDALPTIKGEAEAGSIVNLYDNGVLIGSARADAAGNWEFTPNKPLSNGGHSLTAEATDAAGNVSETSDSFDFTLITGGVPSAPAIIGVLDDVGDIQGNVAKNGVTDDTRPTVHGTAQPGYTVSVYDGDVLLGTTTADENGRWRFTPEVDLAEGEHQLSATATDAAGNISPQTGVYPIIIDTTPPENSGDNTLTDDVGAIQGPINSGDTTDDATPTFDGKTEPGAVVIIRDNGEEIGRVVADKDGNWTFTPEQPLAEGDHSFTVQPVDNAGNKGEESAPVDFIVDTSGVEVTIINVYDDAGEAGYVQKGGVTNDATPTINGSATPGALIHIYDNGELIGSALANYKGEWSFTPAEPLNEGEHSFTATATTEANGVSAPTAPFDLIIDITAPGNDGIDEVQDDVGSVQGPVESGEVTDDSTPTLVGGGTPGDVVTIIDNGETIGSTVIGDDGKWEFTPETPLNDGEHKFETVITDPAGNTSEPSDPYTVIVDTTPPAKPEIGDIIDDVGNETGPIENGESTDDTQPTIGGGGTPGDVVTIIDNGNPIGSTVIGDDGKWEFTPEEPLEDGEHNIGIIVTDPAGNESSPSDDYTIIVDTQAPEKPVIKEVYDNQGDKQGALNPGEVTDDAQPTVRGEAEPGSLVNLYDNGQLVGSAVTNAEGQWEFTPTRPLLNGAHSLTVEAVDAAGNVSEPSDSFDFMLEAGGAPTAPAITGVVDNVGDVQGAIEKGGVTDDVRPGINGTAQPDSVVTVYADGKVLGTALTDAAGKWSFTPDSDLAEGLRNLSATATNAAGNISPSTGLYPIVIDTTAPDASSDNQLTDDVGDIQGPINSGDTTDDAQPTFSGVTEPGATIIIRDNGQPIGSAVAGKDGNWRFTPDQPLADGDHSFTAQPVDKAGNKGTESQPVDFIVDTSAVLVTINSVYDDAGSVTGNLTSGAVSDDTTPTLNGSATPDALIHIYNNGTLIGSAKANYKGEWSFTPDVALAEGEHHFTATATNAAGTSAESSPFDLTIDLTPPVVGGIDSVLDDVGTVQGPVDNGGITDDTTPTLVGEGVPGDVVTIIDNGETIGSAVIGENGKWTFTPETPLNDGEHKFETVITDPAGNSSQPSDPYIVTVDTQAPNKPAITEVFDDQGDRTGALKSGDTTDDSIPTVKGTAEANSLVKIYDNGELIGSVRADGQGNWRFEPGKPLVNGAHSLTVEAIDAAGNASEPSEKFDFSLAAGGKPTAPAITGVMDNVGDIQGAIQKGGLTDDARPTINGTAQPGSIVTLLVDGKAVGSTQADGAGNWSFTPDSDLADGVRNITATATNAAGNISPETGAYPIDIDTSAPEASKGNQLIDDVGLVQGPINSGDITDDATPTFKGKTEPGATVIVRDNGNELGRAVADKDGNWSFTPDQPLADGDHSFTVQPVDKAGNKGPETDAIDFTVDTSKVVIAITQVYDDAGSITGNLTSGQVTDDTTPTLKGTATGNALVKIYDNGQLIGSTVAAKDGSWSFTPGVALSEGPHSLTATATTPAHGESEATAAFDITIDITAPNNAGIEDVRDDVGTEQGTVDNGGATDDTTPTLTGGGKPGDMVTIIDNGETIGSAVIGENGKWTFTPETPLNDGEHKFETVITDPAGNSSKPSDPYVVNVDTQAPNKPAITEVYDDQGDRRGPIAAGDTTDDATPTVRGTAEADSLVNIYDNGVLIGSTRTDSKGNWSFEPPLPLANGAHALTAEAVDAAGNVSESSDKFEFGLISGGVPNAPAITSVMDNVGDIQGLVQKGSVTDDARPTINGTAQPNSLVTLYADGIKLGTVTADANGNWSYTPASDLRDGVHNISATSTNAAGNVSPETGVYPIEVDTTAPGNIINPVLTDDVGQVQGPIRSGETTDDATPTFSGKTEPGATVIVRDNGKELGRAVADDSGNWTFTPGTPLTDGKHSFTAQPVDLAGNQGPIGGAIDFTVDTSAVVVALTRVEDNAGSVTGDLSSGQATDDTTPTLYGTATPNALVKIYDNGKLIGQVSANAQGQWNFTPGTALSEGSHALTVTATTEAHGESEPTSQFDLLIDITAPNKGVIDSVSDDVGTVQGPIGKGGYTDDTTPTLSGRGTPNDKVTIIDNGTPIGEVTVGNDGRWSFTPTTPLNDGTHNFTVVMTDPVGNSSAPSDVWPVIVDTQAPNPVVLTSIMDNVGSVTGPIQRDGTTDDKRPTLNGTAEANSLVTIYIGEVAVGSVKADASGNWSFTPGSDLADGRYEFTVTATDAAGNTSYPTQPWAITVDTVAPNLPAIVRVYDDAGSITGDVLNNGITDDKRPTISGTAEANSIVTVYIDGTPAGTVRTDGSGNWSFTPGSDLADGLHRITATATDTAGNTSGQTAAWNITVDTVAPNAPVIVTIEDDVGSIKGNIDKNGVTDDKRPTINGTAEVNSLVTIYIDGKAVGSTRANGSGNWSFIPASDLSDGLHHISAKASDSAGNSSGEAVTWDITVDTVISTPTIDTVYDNAGSKTGNVANGGKTDDTTPTLSGKAEANSVVTIYDGSTKLGSVTAGADGKWTFTPSPALSKGTHNFSVQATDQAGNNSEKSPGWNIIIANDVDLVKGSEDFNNAGGTGYKNSYTLPSGLTFSSDGEWQIGGSKNGTNILAMWQYTTVTFTFGVNKVISDIEFTVLGWGSVQGQPSRPMTIKIFDEEGVLISTQSIWANLYESKKFEYVAPAGKVIGKVEMYTDDPYGLGIDNVSWSKHSNAASSTAYNDFITSEDESLSYMVQDSHRFEKEEEPLFTHENEELKNMNLSELIVFSSEGIGLISSNQSIIDGSIDDRIILSDLLKDGTDLGDWSQVAGTITQGGHVYDVYRHSGVEGELLVQQGVKVELDNH